MATRSPRCSPNAPASRFLDREALAPLAREIEKDFQLCDVEAIEEHLVGRLAPLALGVAVSGGSPDAVRRAAAAPVPARAGARVC